MNPIRTCASNLYKNAPTRIYSLKIFLISLTIFCWLNSCGFKPVTHSSKTHSKAVRVPEESHTEEVDTGPVLTEYTLIALRPLVLFGSDGVGKTRYEDIPAGDTLIVTAPQLSYTMTAIYKATPVLVTGVKGGVDVVNWKILNKYEKAKYVTPQVADYKGQFKIFKDPFPDVLPTKALRDDVETDNVVNTSDDLSKDYSGYTTKSSNRSSSVTSRKSSAANSTIYTGPRGGRYYINSNGNKTYLKSNSSRSSAGSYRRSSSSSSYRRSYSGSSYRRK